MEQHTFEEHHCKICGNFIQHDNPRFHEGVCSDECSRQAQYCDKEFQEEEFRFY